MYRKRNNPKLYSRLVDIIMCRKRNRIIDFAMCRKRNRIIDIIMYRNYKRSIYYNISIKENFKILLIELV
jgi:hypothetical protein